MLLAGDERLGRGREYYRRRVWRAAWELLSACDFESPLQVADLELLAVASFLSGQDGASDGAWARAHQRHLQTGNRPGAVRCAFWLAFRLLNGGTCRARAAGSLGSSGCCARRRTTPPSVGS
jgi:hypothetical protein